jgi:hypothetical protein
VREVGKFGHGLHLQLGPEIGAVRFDGALAGVDVGGDLLVQLAAQNMGHHFTLPRRERIESGAQFTAAGALRAIPHVAR